MVKVKYRAETTVEEWGIWGLGCGPWRDTYEEAEQDVMEALSSPTSWKGDMGRVVKAYVRVDSGQGE